MRMYHDDHKSPHIHVEYQGHEVLIVIDSGDILVVSLPGKAHKIV
ncbi:MAG: DUF4160 domain-containing protein [Methyloprofundus sp.]|nr:DUF4160 domain-containing protein [Methyloprofundus sp.]